MTVGWKDIERKVIGDSQKQKRRVQEGQLIHENSFTNSFMIEKAVTRGSISRTEKALEREGTRAQVAVHAKE